MTVIYLGGYQFLMKELNRYEDWMRGQNASPNTIAQRMDFARRCLRQWGTLNPPASQVRSWLAGYSGWSQRTYYGHLSSLFAWLRAEGMLEADPLLDFKLKPCPRPRPRPLRPIDVDAVLGEATGRVRAWLLLALLAGLRCHEVAKVRGEDITETTIYVLGKGAQSAILPTHPALWALAQTYPRSGWWFPSPRRDGPIRPDSISRTIRRLFESHGLDGSIHRCRATYGTTLLRNGATIKVVQELMRHRSLASTEHYLGLDGEELARAIESLAA